MFFSDGVSIQVPVDFSLVSPPILMKGKRVPCQGSHNLRGPCVGAY